MAWTCTALIEDMLNLARREADNVQATIPLVCAHSRLGWEPSMGYTTDPAHLDWKLEQLRRVTDIELPAYHNLLTTT